MALPPRFGGSKVSVWDRFCDTIGVSVRGIRSSSPSAGGAELVVGAEYSDRAIGGAKISALVGPPTPEYAEPGCRSNTGPGGSFVRSEL